MLPLLLPPSSTELPPSVNALALASNVKELNSVPLAKLSLVMRLLLVVKIRLSPADGAVPPQFAPVSQLASPPVPVHVSVPAASAERGPASSAGAIAVAAAHINRWNPRGRERLHDEPRSDERAQWRRCCMRALRNVGARPRRGRTRSGQTVK